MLRPYEAITAGGAFPDGQPIWVGAGRGAHHRRHHRVTGRRALRRLARGPPRRLPVHGASLEGDRCASPPGSTSAAPTSTGCSATTAILAITLSRVDGAWTLTGIDARDGETLTRDGRAFTDVTAAAGLADLIVYPRVEALRRGGYGIAAGDVDNDGDIDLYLGNWGVASLMLNNGDGTYTDATAASGLGGVDRVKAAALADMDNDGDRDLVLSRFVDDDPDDVMVFAGNGDGTFQRVEGAVRRTSPTTAPCP